MSLRIFEMLHVSIRPCRVLVACALAALLAGPVRGGTIAHWSFDAPDADGTYPDSEKTRPAKPQDTSAVQAYSGSVPARFGKGITLTGAANSYLTIPQLTGIQRNSFTVAAWVNFNTKGPNFVLADWQNAQQAGFVFGVDPLGGDKSTAQPIADLASTENAPPAARGRNPGGGTARPPAPARLSVVRQAIPGKAVPLNEWHHLAWTWDRDNATLTTYLDGESIGEQKKQTGNGFSRSTNLDMAVNNRPTRIGSREMPASGTRGPVNFNGSLAELWIFDQPLTPIQIRNLMQTNDIRGAAAAAPVAAPAVPATATAGTTPEAAAPAPPDHSAAPSPNPASEGRPVVPVLSTRGISPVRLGGIVACLTLIVAISCYLIWAVTERTKMRALGRL